MWEYKGINWRSDDIEHKDYQNIIGNARVFDKNGNEITDI